MHSHSRIMTQLGHMVSCFLMFLFYFLYRDSPMTSLLFLSLAVTDTFRLAQAIRWSGPKKKDHEK
jgi:hypothetical protein